MNRLALVLLTACAGPGPEGDTGSAEDTAAPSGLLLGLCDAFVVDRLQGVDDLAGGLASLDEARDLGLSLVRPHRPRGHAFARSVVYPGGAETPDWTLPDAVVREVHARGLDVQATVYPFTDGRPAAESPPGVVPIPAPANPDAWSRFVGDLVERYDGDGVSDMDGLLRPVRTWEIGNEPYCEVTDDGCHQAFLDVVSLAWVAARAADPEATVVAGGASPPFLPDGRESAETAATWAWFFAHGGAEVTDAISVHHAPGTTTPPLDALLDWWEERADGLPLWLGETGSRGFHDGVVVSVDPQVEAAWADDWLAAAFARVDRVMWCGGALPLARAPEVAAVLSRWAEETSP
jgi:hypothetical protein